MPHYEDGTKAEIGDEVECPGHYNKIRHGIAFAIYEGATSCNLGVAHLQKTVLPSSNPPTVLLSTTTSTCTAKECKKLV